MRKRILLTGAFSLMMFSNVFSQVKVGDNPAIIDNNAVLEIESTNKGVLIPRMALDDAATEAPLAAPLTEGMMIYSLGGTEPNGFYYWNGTTWRPFNETLTTLVDNGDGSYTYTSEDGTQTTISAPSVNVSTGTGTPTTIGTAGDIYTDSTTGDIYTYNGTTGAWENQAENLTTLVDNGDGSHTYTSEDGTATTFNTPDGNVSTGTGAPTGTGTGGDIYVDDATGDIYTYNGTTGAWENQAENLTTLVDNGDGSFIYTSEDGTQTTFTAPTETTTTLVDNGDGTYTYTSEDSTEVTFNSSDVSLSSGLGAPSATGNAGDVYVDEATGDIYTYNGVTNQWENQTETITALVDNMDGTYTYTSEDGTASVIDANAPGYSTTEYLTGKEWIDGKDVYEVVVTRAVTTTSSSISLVGSPVDNATAILDVRVVGTTGGVYHSNSFNFTTKNLIVGSARQGTFLSPGTYNIIVEYIK